VELSGEAALVSGHTDRAISYNAPEGLDVLSLGWALRGDLELGNTRLRAEVGYASGDDNPDDDANHVFGFDPNYRVGLVLFDDVLALRSIRTVERISDPDLSARPPKGADGLETDGRVSGVTYFNPTLRTRPLPWLTVSGGLVLAWSSATHADAFTSYQAGGQPRTAFDEPVAGSYLGTEIDAGVAVEYDVSEIVAFSAGLQAGVFEPADDGDLTVTKVVLAAGVRH